MIPCISRSLGVRKEPRESSCTLKLLANCPIKEYQGRPKLKLSLYTLHTYFLPLMLLEDVLETVEQLIVLWFCKHNRLLVWQTGVANLRRTIAGLSRWIEGSAICRAHGPRHPPTPSRSIHPLLLSGRRRRRSARSEREPSGHHCRVITAL